MNRMLLNEVLATSHTARDAELANSELVSLYVVPDSPLSIVVGGVQLPTNIQQYFIQTRSEYSSLYVSGKLVSTSGWLRVD